MTDQFTNDVRAFQRRFNQSCPDRAGVAGDDVIDTRVRLLREEARELLGELALLKWKRTDEQLAAVAAEAVDVIYVALGTLVSLGLTLEDCWAPVHRANMLKTPNASGGKPLKPDGWCKPDLLSVVTNQTASSVDRGLHRAALEAGVDLTEPE